MSAEFEVQVKKLVDGPTIDHLVAGADYVANTFIIIDELLCFGQTSALIGERVTLFTMSIVEVKGKDADVFAEGNKVYWDDTAKEFTITPSGDAFAGLCMKGKLGVAGFPWVALNLVQGA